MTINEAKHDVMMASVSDDISRARRRDAALKMVEELTTEEIEIVNKYFPHLAKCAMHEILNPPDEEGWNPI